MKVDHNDFRERFAGLSDAGLLSINRDELVDVARQCYDLEVARRGLQCEHESWEAPESFPKLVGVLDTNDNFALASACSALDDAGIIYDVVGIADVPDALKQPDPKWWIAPCRILVAKEDEAEARELTSAFLEPLVDSEIRPEDI